MRILSWMVHRVTRKQRTGSNAKGDPTYGAATAIKARVEKTRKRVLDAVGMETVSEFTMATDTLDVSLSDVFWFPSISGEPADDTSNANAGRMPIAIDRATTKTGQALFVVVYF